MNTIKKIGLVGAVAFALFTFNACGDDSSSTSASGENSALSSAVEDDASSSSINGDTSSVIPGSSSSVILSDSEGSSSSVKGSDTADVSSSSVIPDPDRESNSSSVKSSSSSAKSSSSVNSSSSVKSSSSSSVKRSSSSVAKSSSSGEYIPFDHSLTLAGARFVGEDAYHQFTDDRNGRSYYYITITGKDTSGNAASVTVMAENLNIGVDVLGTQDQTDDKVIERYCYNDDTTNCDRYGGLYQWAEMMQLPSACNNMDCSDRYDPSNHRGICPENWRILTYNDFYVILNSNGNTHGIEGLRSTFGCGGYNETGFSLVCSGYNWEYKYKNLDKGIYWFYPEESFSDSQNASGSFTGLSMTTVRKGSYNKSHGFTVRCVMSK
ncbi:major paralogous domain-containing protein [Fibrobacter sp. UWH9]|uniref:FISUMP domain-containing protein n=1 Tax=Fibrobacter sp. UWH9 TaxID=1896213 RepID=UPI000916D19C|nr:FISUMP domain-containing protein [Fibrobacter sp. UWH9]SHG29035.1 major paralogous domain-containing protein [Fibrobacter sp. UWH9]